MIIKFRRKLLIIATFCALTFIFGIVVGKMKQEDELLNSLNLFSETLYYVKTRYVENVDDSRIFHGAMQGLAENLDPESFYMNEDQYREFLNTDKTLPPDATGIKVIKLNSYLRIIAIEPGSPAGKAGIKPGDYLTHIAGFSGYDLSLYTAYKLLSGEPGSKISIDILNNITGGEKKFDLIRSNIKPKKPLFDTFDDDIAYIKLIHFYKSDIEILKKYLQTEHYETILIDVRDNYEGSTEALKYALDMFIPDGKLFTKLQSKNDRTDYMALKDTIKPPKEIILITSATTTHNAELFAAILQEKKIAKLYGFKTRGMIGNQSVFPLDNSGALYITTTVYLTPSEKNIYMKGINPDFEIKVERKDIKKIEKVRSDNGIIEKEDITLFKTLEKIQE